MTPSLSTRNSFTSPVWNIKFRDLLGGTNENGFDNVGMTNRIGVDLVRGKPGKGGFRKENGDLKYHPYSFDGIYMFEKNLTKEVEK